MSESKISTKELEDSIQIDFDDDVQLTGEVEKISSKHEISVKECPVNNVTVFIDRAEVNRLVEVDVVAGDVEVLVKDLPVVIDKDSVR